MIYKMKRGLGLVGILVVVLALVSACATAPTQPPEQSELVYPTVIITQYVTQIVATPTITPIPPPTKQVQVITPAVYTGWDPFKVDIYYPIKGCVASRLYIDDVAFVAGGPVGLHMSENVLDSPTYRNLEPGELIDIEAGPWCINSTLVWKVGAEDGSVGFAAEGNGENYYLLPMPPGTDEVISKADIKLQELLQEGGTFELQRIK